MFSFDLPAPVLPDAEVSGSATACCAAAPERSSLRTAASLAGFVFVGIPVHGTKSLECHVLSADQRQVLGVWGGPWSVGLTGRLTPNATSFSS